MNHYDRMLSEECPSGYRLDKLLADELDGGAAAAVRDHLARCEPCRARGAEMEERQSRFLAAPPALRRAPAIGSSLNPPLRAVSAAPAGTAPARVRRRRGQAASGAVLAAAAAAAIVLGTTAGPDPGEHRATPAPAPLTRTKGAGTGIRFYVEHRGAVRAGGPGEIVHPGDVLQFIHTSAEAEYLSLLSRDGGGTVSIYFADEGRAAPVEPASGMLLPQSVRLDGILGPEVFYQLACETPIALEPVRQELERGPWLVAPEGCRLDMVRIEKRAP
jgi:hypothetical protein